MKDKNIVLKNGLFERMIKEKLNKNESFKITRTTKGIKIELENKEKEYRVFIVKDEEELNEFLRVIKWTLDVYK